MAVKTTKIQCNQDVDLRGKADIEGKVTCGGDAEIDGNLIVNSAANIKDKSLTSADAGKVLTVSEDGSISWQQKGAGGGMKAFFDAGGMCGYSTLTSFDGIINFGDTSDVTSMEHMFSSCNITTIPLIDTSKVTTMSFMFQYCKKLKTIPKLDTSNVKNMSYMFNLCKDLTSVPNIDAFKVTNMYFMFYECNHLEEIHMINIGDDLDIHFSTLFTREALLEIIGNLKTVTRTKTLTMGATNLAKLTDEDKAIATNKGWTLA